VSGFFLPFPKKIPLEEIKSKYDVVIIGGGVSGLTSSALLSKAGLSVCVLEMDARPGGYLAGFRRKDFRFDSAIHWLNQCGDKGFVNRIFNSIGSDFPKAKEQVKIRRFISEDLNFLMTNTPDDFKNELIKAFPHEKKGLDRFFKEAKKMARSFDEYSTIFRSMETRNFFGKMRFGLRMMKFGMSFIPHIFYAGDEGTQKGLKKYFTDPKLLSFWSAETDLLSCLIPIAWAYNKDFQFPPEGGGQVFPEWLVHATEQMGGQVFYRMKALKIVDDGTKAISVIADQKGKKHEFFTNYVVAACDVELLYEKLMDSKFANPSFLTKLKNAELYSSAVTLSIGLDCTTESLGFNEEMLLISKKNKTREDHNSGDPHTSDLSILAPSVRDKSLAPEGKGTLTVYSPAHFHQYEEWGTERDENGVPIRTEKYKQIKDEYAAVVIERVEKAMNVDLKNHIIYLDIATPITHHRYTGNKNGTMMGARPGKANYKAKIAHYKTPLKNVFLSGHWADLGGGVPIAVSTAANSSLLILKQENKAAFKALSEFFDGNISLEKFNKMDGLKEYTPNWTQKPTPSIAKQMRLQDN